MLFTTPEQFIILAVVLLSGWLLGYASAPSVKKLRRKVRAQSDSFSAYHYDAEDKLRAAQQRANDLKAEADALRADHAEAERTIEGLRAAQSDAHRTIAELRAAPVPVAVETPVEMPASAEAAQPALARVEPPPVTKATAVSIKPEAVEIEPADRTPKAEEHAAPGLTETPAEPAEPSHDELPPTLPPPPAVERGSAIDSAPIESAAGTREDHDAATDAPIPIGPSSEVPSKGWFGSTARDDLTRIRGIDSVLNTRLFGLGVTRFEDIEKLSAEDEMALEQRLSLPAGYIAREQWRTQAALLRAGKDDEHATHFAAVEA